MCCLLGLLSREGSNTYLSMPVCVCALGTSSVGSSVPKQGTKGTEKVFARFAVKARARNGIAGGLFTFYYEFSINHARRCAVSGTVQTSVYEMKQKEAKQKKAKKHGWKN